MNTALLSASRPGDQVPLLNTLTVYDPSAPQSRVIWCACGGSAPAGTIQPRTTLPSTPATTAARLIGLSLPGPGLGPIERRSSAGHLKLLVGWLSAALLWLRLGQPLAAHLARCRAAAPVGQ